MNYGQKKLKACRYINIDTLMSDLAYHLTEAVQLMLLGIRKSDILVI